MAAALISVVIPVYNGARYLGEALESVRAQDYRPVEVIVVDDGSTDGSAELAGAFPGVRCLRQPNGGVAAARNAGINASRGELIAFLDQDDRWADGKLTRQARYLEAHPGVQYVLARQRFFLEPGTRRPSWVRPGWLEADQIGYLPGTLMVRRSAFERIGVFDPAYRSGDDSDWFARARDAGLAMAILPDVLLHRRIHDSNLSARTGLAQSELLKAMKASIGRRRRSQERRL